MSQLLSFSKISVLGGGAWGIALAVALHRAGRDVCLWVRSSDQAETLQQTRQNALRLPGVLLDPAIRVTTDLAEAAEAEALFLVVPTQGLRSVLAGLDLRGRAQVPLVLCAKGIEQEYLALPSAIVRTRFPENPVAALSGPTFAVDVAAGLPTAATLAATDEIIGKALCRSISTPTFRPYYSDDLTGVEVGGAIKNVLAIACGIVQGRGLGDSARAALLTRGVAEMTRLAVALGGRAETLMGLSGLGDLTLTCGSLQSRNMSLGVALGQGRPLAAILAERQSVAEGMFTAAAAIQLAAKYAVDMPIVQAVDAILNQGADINATIAALLARPLRDENS
jgi:glycerol-3-phosphate dehydrogenase (NAD(P)+)